MTMTNSDMQSGTTRVNGPGTTLVELEAGYEETSTERGTARVSTSTKLSGTNKVTPPLVTQLVKNGASKEEALTRIGDSVSEQKKNRCQ